MNVNYTKEQTDKMVADYLKDPGLHTVDLIAEELGKTKKSVIGKLSREKVYQKKEYTTKRGDQPITKKDIIEKLAKTIHVTSASIAGLIKASKSDLINLENGIAQQIAGDSKR